MGSEETLLESTNQSSSTKWCSLGSQVYFKWQRRQTSQNRWLTTNQWRLLCIRTLSCCSVSDMLMLRRRTMNSIRSGKQSRRTPLESQVCFTMKFLSERLWSWSWYIRLRRKWNQQTSSSPVWSKVSVSNLELNRASSSLLLSRTQLWKRSLWRLSLISRVSSWKSWSSLWSERKIGRNRGEVGGIRQWETPCSLTVHLELTRNLSWSHLFVSEERVMFLHRSFLRWWNLRRRGRLREELLLIKHHQRWMSRSKSSQPSLLPFYRKCCSNERWSRRASWNTWRRQLCLNKLLLPRIKFQR